MTSSRLSPTGQGQALGTLPGPVWRAGPALRVILSSPTVRCRETDYPLAESLGLEVTCDLWVAMPWPPGRSTTQWLGTL